jgi:hypothetical protein
LKILRLVCAVSCAALLASPALAEPLPDLVRKTYVQYAWVTLFSDPAIEAKYKQLSKENLTHLRAIFVPDLALAIYQDSRCVIQSGEICNLDSDILFSSQDPLAHDLVITSSGKNSATACFLAQQGRRRCFEFEGKMSGGKMLIYDIKYDQEGHTLRSMLSMNH